MTTSDAEKIARIKVILEQPLAIYPDLSESARKAGNLAAKGKGIRAIAIALHMAEGYIGQLLREIRIKTGKSKADLPGELYRQIREVIYDPLEDK